MAQDTVITCTAGAWTQLTDADVAADISLSVTSMRGVLLRATTDATTPTATDGFPLPGYGDGWSEATIVEKFPGVAGAVRLWAYPIGTGTKSALVRVSHGA